MAVVGTNPMLATLALDPGSESSPPPASNPATIIHNFTLHQMEGSCRCFLTSTTIIGPRRLWGTTAKPKLQPRCSRGVTMYTWAGTETCLTVAVVAAKPARCVEGGVAEGAMHFTTKSTPRLSNGCHHSRRPQNPWVARALHHPE